MEVSSIQFLSRKHTGGYGDRLIGMASVLTIARILGFHFQYSWEEEFMNHCQPSELNCVDETLDLINQNNSHILETEDLLTAWKGKTIAIKANIPIHSGLWKNPFLRERTAGRIYETETIQSFQEIFSKYIRFLTPFSERKYDCGIQIRVGDTYCMPHSLAEQYIPTSAFPTLARTMKSYLQKRGIRGHIYVTSDTFHIYKDFTELNDSDYTFVFRERTDDIHFDYHNSNNRYREVLEDHYSLMNCKTVITGLRSNFGTTAAYCSPDCSELVIYTSEWKGKITYKLYNPKSTLVLKEYKESITASIDIQEVQDPLVPE